MNEKELTSATSRPTQFPFLELPLELRRLVYDFTDLRAPFVLRSDHILDYIDGKKTRIAPLLNVHPRIQAEAFAAVVQQNVIDITELVYVFPIMENYIKDVQADMDLWRNIRVARIDYNAAFITNDDMPSGYTKHIINFLNRCKRLEQLELYFCPKTSRYQVGCLDKSSIIEALSNMPCLRRVLVCWPVGDMSNDLSMHVYALFLDWLEDVMDHVQDQLKQRKSTVVVEMKCDNA